MKTIRRMCLFSLVLTSISIGSIPAVSIGAPRQDRAVLSGDESFVVARAVSNGSAQVPGTPFPLAGGVLPSDPTQSENESRTVTADTSTLSRLQEWLHHHAGYPGAIDGRFGRESWRSLQQYLKVEGVYEGELDGQPGAATREALKKLQKSLGLEETGKLDAATVQKLTVEGRMARALHAAHWFPIIVLVLCCVLAWALTWFQLNRTLTAGTAIWRSPFAYAVGCTALVMAWIGFAGIEPLVRGQPATVIAYLVMCVAALVFLPIRIVRWLSIFLSRNWRSVVLAYAVIQTSGILICTAIFPFVEGPADMPATVNAHAFMGAAFVSFTVVLIFTAVPTLLYAGVIAGFASWLRSRRLTPWCLYPFAIVLTTIVFSFFTISTGGPKTDAEVTAFFMAILLAPSLMGTGALHILDMKQRRASPRAQLPEPHR